MLPYEMQYYNRPKPKDDPDMTAEEIYNKHGKKAYNKHNDQLEDEAIEFVSVPAWVIEAVAEYANQKALSIIEQAVGEVGAKYSANDPSQTACDKILQAVRRKLGGGS